MIRMRIGSRYLDPLPTSPISTSEMGEELLPLQKCFSFGEGWGGGQDFNRKNQIDAKGWLT